jgi:hypothetical protein
MGRTRETILVITSVLEIEVNTITNLPPYRLHRKDFGSNGIFVYLQEWFV